MSKTRRIMNELALFAGAGGGILGGHLLGWRTVCAVEWEPYPASVLVARQNDKVLPPFPIWDDIRTFDGKPWRGIAQVVSGGFPCQDISAGGKAKGIEGERSGMWREMVRVIYEVLPEFVFVENSPMLTSRGLGRVLGDLATMGFDAKWGVLGASDIGANHQRERIWIVAKNVSNSNGSLCRGRGTIRQGGEDSIGRVYSEKTQQTQYDIWCKAFRRNPIRREKEKQTDWWKVESNLDRVVDGMASRVDRLKAIGNGQVPLCAATAWRILSGCS
jgi:DNA (cytosine-5)-methyltransferase 1